MSGLAADRVTAALGPRPGLRPLEITIVDAETVAAVAPSMPETVALVEEAIRREGLEAVEAPAEVGVHPDHPGSFLFAKVAWVPDAGALGCKWYSYYPGNFARGVLESTSLVVLNDPDTGMPTALVESTWLTNARTAATAAVAAKALGPPSVARVGLIGAGGLGRASVAALAATFRGLEEIRVASRTPASREALCRELSGLGGFDLVPVDEVRDAVTGMDVVISSTPQPPEPVVRREWWDPRTLVVALDGVSCWEAGVFADAARLVTDDHESVVAFNERRPSPVPLPADWDRLGAVVAGRADARRAPDEGIVVVSVGRAPVDVVVARELHRRAIEAGRGTRVRLA